MTACRASEGVTRDVLEQVEVIEQTPLLVLKIATMSIPLLRAQIARTNPPDKLPLSLDERQYVPSVNSAHATEICTTGHCDSKDSQRIERGW